MSYVKVKHTLAELALDATEHLDRAWVADALLAYAELSRDGAPVDLAAIARAVRVPPEDVRRMAEASGLFDVMEDGGAIALAAPYRAFLPYLRRQAARTAAAVRLLRGERPPGVPPEIWRAAALFGAGLFFECHEYLEDIWRATPGPERSFYHGLVQAAAGCYHLEKGNLHGAGTLLGKAIAKLAPFAPEYCAVDVAAFLAGLRCLRSSLETGGGAPGGIAFPPLYLAGSSQTRPVQARGAPPPRRPFS